MKNVLLRLVKSFTNDSSQGNPAAVCFSSVNFTDTECKKITRQSGVSESVFVSMIDNIPFLRFFSPEQEMNMCGHATLAAIHLLDNKPAIVKTKSGDILIHYNENGLIEMEITANPRYYPDVPATNRIADLLGIPPSAIITNPVKVSVGTPKVLVGLQDVDTLWSVKPKFADLIHEIPQGIYPYVTIDEKLYYARQFNPATGIHEDPVTGVAAAALGIYLKANLIVSERFKVEQGHMVDKKGTIFVDVTNGIKIGGYAVAYDELVLNI